MSERDLQRIEVLGEVLRGQRTITSAATVLALSARQVHRLLRRYREYGAGGLTHRARGRRANNRIKDAVREHAIELVRTNYADFGPTLAAEMLAEKHGLMVSRETLRTWMTDSRAVVVAPAAPPLSSAAAAARVLWASWSRSTAASIAGSRTAPIPAPCSCSSTTRPAA